MDSTDNNKLSEIVEILRSWIPMRAEPGNMSRDFWMPDESCRVCYECDSPFTIFNRKHHCRLCGRVFCGRCTINTVPAHPDEPKSGREDGDRIKVCNYCFKQWKQQSATGSNVMQSCPGLTPSPSSSSLVSSQSSCCTSNSGSSAGSTEFSTGPFQHVSCGVGRSPHPSAKMDSKSQKSPKQDQARSPGKLDYLDSMDPFSHQLGSCSRSDDEDDDYPIHRSHSETTIVIPDMGYGTNDYCQIDHIYEPHEAQPNEEITNPAYNSAVVAENFETQGSLDYGTRNEADVQNTHVQSGSSLLNVMDGADVEAVDYENNGLIWLPPEPEDEEDEREVFVSDDDDDPGEDATGEWGYLRSSSFLVGELRNRDRSNEEHRKAMKRVVEGHFRTLISQLLQAENLPTPDHESWLDIITKLSWEAATLLKPDTSRGGGMDPGGYVKVKCIACGNRSESTVIKGIVCKKHVAHRRMNSKIDKARLLLLGGALEYQRVANHLSSFDTLLQQEMDHLKMAVAKIDAHHPNILLVEKSVSRYAQEYLLAKNISLVLNIKRPLLERIARCSGAQIVPSVDSLSAPKLGFCELFRVEKFLEDLGSAGQGGKKLMKTLMFFEGCPRPLGCTILLKGASGDELKKVKHVVHYGVFAAYHLALETSFLADEGASLPELPLKSPIKVALPDNPSSIDRSISMIPGYNSPSTEKLQSQQEPNNAFQSRNDLFLDSRQSSLFKLSEEESIFSKGSIAHSPNAESRIRNVDATTSGADLLGSQWEQLSDIPYSMDRSRLEASGRCDTKSLGYLERNDTLNSNHLFESEDLGQGFSFSPGNENIQPLNLDKSESLLSGQHDTDCPVELETLRDEFPPSPSDHQSILVSLSTRCVLKGSVCERAHLFRIKYYGNFDKPLGRFLQDHLFDQGFHCRSCEMPSEAHVHCYTHQQGSLTISVKKLEESLLSGEREGKIWMWHRCLQCPRTNGFPPATKRVVMSDAAWGLSFGKFLELSFSNHAAASRVASCGHSLHRDCLRFYGFGRMVACFRYAPINVHSVHLPPPKLEFNYYKEKWIQKEFEDVSWRADLLFTEVLEVLHEMSDRVKDDAGKTTDDNRKLIAELEMMLQKEIQEFEESLWCVVKKEVKYGQPEMDILEINRIRRQLVFHSYVWDQRLMHLSKYNVQSLSSSILKEKPANLRKKRSEVEVVSRSSRGFSSWDSSFAHMIPFVMPNEGEDCQIICPNGIHKGLDIVRALSNIEDANSFRSSDTNLSKQSDIPEYGKTVRRARSEGQFPVMENISDNDNLDTACAWNQQPENVYCEYKTVSSPNTFQRESSGTSSTTAGPVVGRCKNDRSVGEDTNPIRSGLPAKGPNDLENPRNWLSIPFLALYRSLNKNFSTAQKLAKITDYNPVCISSFRELVNMGGARLLLPTACSDIIVPIYDDEPTSVISYALVSPEYQNFMAEESDKQKHSLEASSSFSILDPVNFFSLNSFDEPSSESMKSLGSADESILSSGSRSFSGLDSLLFPSTSHSRISFTDDGPPGKVKYSVTCYFAKQFEALRKTCCPSELDFIRSLSRCKKWGAQGGKSNVFFAKTLDDRFIIKQVTKTELESFIKFSPSYFKYLSESINIGCPTSLAKILGIYQVTSKHLKGGKESRMDVLVMENLLFRRNITRLYDLKGSARSRYNPDSNGSNKVLLDQNLIEAMPTSPIFLGTKAKRLLERAVWNDTSFLASIDVMDYSLLVGMDEEKHELVLGIIDFMRQYTWDKHLETWVKASGILGGPKNASPTIISPKQYKKRFRKAMSAYFLMVPDQWLSSTILTSSSQSDLCEENS